MLVDNIGVRGDLNISRIGSTFDGRAKSFGSVLRLSWDCRLFPKVFDVFQRIGQGMSHSMGRQQGEQVQTRSFLNFSSNPPVWVTVTLIELVACKRYYYLISNAFSGVQLWQHGCYRERD